MYMYIYILLNYKHMWQQRIGGNMAATAMVGGIPIPLKHISQLGVGSIIPNIWKNKIHVPNHQSAIMGKLMWLI